MDSNLFLLWSLTRLLVSCLAVSVGRAHSLDVVISLADLAICLADSIGDSSFLDNQGLSILKQISVSTLLPWTDDVIF